MVYLPSEDKDEAAPEGGARGGGYRFDSIPRDGWHPARCVGVERQKWDNDGEDCWSVTWEVDGTCGTLAKVDQKLDLDEPEGRADLRQLLRAVTGASWTGGEVDLGEVLDGARAEVLLKAGRKRSFVNGTRAAPAGAGVKADDLPDW